jgi:hypothetical protein
MFGSWQNISTMKQILSCKEKTSLEMDNTGQDDWEGLGLDIEQRKKVKRRLRPQKQKTKKRKIRRHKAAYDPSPLEDLFSNVGEGSAKLLALQRGKTVTTTNSNDKMRAQTTTAKTFNGIDNLDNFITYDRNLTAIAAPVSMAAQFGNYQVQQVAKDTARGKKRIKLRQSCPF